MEVVTDRGLLMMTTHSYNFINRKDIGAYNKDETPVSNRNNPRDFQADGWRADGLSIPLILLLPGEKMHRNLLSVMKNYEALGEGTPLFRFARTGGKILMIGCDLEACTMVHEAEWEAQVPYLDINYDPDWGREALYYDDKGELIRVHYENIPGCSHGFVKMPTRAYRYWMPG